MGTGGSLDVKGYCSLCSRLLRVVMSLWTALLRPGLLSGRVVLTIV